MLKKIFSGLVLLGLTGCTCIDTAERQRTQLEQPVTIIATKDDITIYKIRDTTSGGPSWIYFSSKGNVSVP